MEGMQADFGGEILIGIEKECAKAGYSAIIKFSYGNEERERACIDELLDAGVEGMCSSAFCLAFKSPWAFLILSALQ